MDTNLDFKDIGVRLRKQREFLGYSREEVATILGIATKSYGNIELGIDRFSVQLLDKLSYNLLISIDYILYGASKSISPLPDDFLSMLEQCPVEKVPNMQELLKVFLLAL